MNENRGEVAACLDSFRRPSKTSQPSSTEAAKLIKSYHHCNHLSTPKLTKSIKCLPALISRNYITKLQLLLNLNLRESKNHGGAR